MRNQLPPLTPQAFYTYLKCPNWTYWDLFGDPKEKGDVPEMIKRLRDEGVLHEKDVVAKLGPFEELPSDGPPERLFAATLEAMKRGAPLIYQGTLMDDDWVGRPDLLRRIDEPSKLGTWSYEAVDIKSSREISESQSYQLVFYALLLKRIQGVKPETLRIINVDGEERAMPIDEAESGFFRILDRILAIRAGEKPEALFTSGCKESPWFESCKREAEARDDISLIYKIYRSEAQRLKEAGYATLASLAGADPSVLREAVAGISDQRLERLRLQAVSLRERRIIRLDEPRLPESRAELFFDIEGDPMQGVEYLHGILLREGGEERYGAFVAETPEPKDEARAWTAFCDFVEKYAGSPIYHYGWYELDAVRRLSSRYGISRKAAMALDPCNMIDLMRVAQRCAVFPLYFLSLKDVARHLGFSWRASDASGANSVLWFQDWQAKGDLALRSKIIEYNEDDVRATAFLKDWLVSGA